MAEEIVAVVPVRAISRTGTLKYQERADQVRSERRKQAAAAAAELFRTAASEQTLDLPVWVRAVTLLMEAIRAGYATVTMVQAMEARCCRITTGYGLEGRDSRRWSPAGSTGGSAGATKTRVEIERLFPVPTSTPITTTPVPGAVSSFHALLYVPRHPQPLGCLSLYSSEDLVLAADRIALIDAVAERLARGLVESPLPDPTSD